MATGQPPNPRQFGHEFVDMEQAEIAEEAEAARQHRDEHDSRPPATRFWRWITIRLALVLAALIALRFGVTQMQDWELRSRASFHHSWQGWIGWLLLVVLSGFLFALAARLPRSLRYRPWTPLLVGIVPLLMLAHFIALLTLNWAGAPSVYLGQYFYEGIEVQFALAIMLGVALASGFEKQRG